MLNFNTKVESKEDNTIKYVFDIKGQIVEFSYIDNGTNKDIICVPCQTMCNMMCTFCHLTDHIGKIPLKDMSGEEISSGVEYIYQDLNLGSRTLLISYMGCGEALANINNVIDSMISIKNSYKNIRFGLATMLPKKHYKALSELTDAVILNDLSLKIHLSMHFVDDKQRKEWIPSGLDLETSLSMLTKYRDVTNNPIEVHYTIMKDVNDTPEHIDKLASLIDNQTTIKFMRFSEKENLNIERADDKRLESYVNELTKSGKIVEYYKPPGDSIGSSCGVFLTELLVADELI